ncbi:alpha-2,8-sialyltransferase 8F-like isoform X1 [Amphiura filiformis]|uniref:alpha-2,8-sialyltransferase 8F-like isoform X1 n=1 Tax=Amphiura filiformis TaxID=82378 RepID=UPI003B2124C2
MLPKTSLLSSSPYETCSVVGSGGILAGSKCGQLIDSMDFVFRFNLAPTNGYEQDVGNRTNLTTMNPSIHRGEFGNLKTSEQVTNFTRMLSGQKGFVWTPAFGFKGYYKDSLKAIQKANGSNPNLTFILEGTKHFKASQIFWKQYGMKKMPSTGFYIVNCALALCKNVHIFGFWPLKKTLDGRIAPYHYYNEVVGKSHDFSTELKWILTMHHFGLLKLHVGNCTDG